MSLPTPTHLYRFFGTDNRLLYVGITHYPSARFSQHKNHKPWSEIRRIELETFPDRQSAEIAERLAIQQEGPLWNVVYAGEKFISDDPKPQTTTPDGLIGHCFHSFQTKEDGCQLVEWQGQVLSKIAEGFYLVETYDWLMGTAHNRMVIALTDMQGWAFYEDDEWMRDAYDHSLSKRSDFHFQHTNSSKTSTRVVNGWDFVSQEGSV